MYFAHGTLSQVGAQSSRDSLFTSLGAGALGAEEEGELSSALVQTNPQSQLWCWCRHSFCLGGSLFVLATGKLRGKSES